MPPPGSVLASVTVDKMNDSSERGIGFQAFGFAVVGCASLAILQFGSESGSWAYQSFETAATRLYWAFVVPLAALFDWGRKMFETRKAIREAALRKAIQKAVENERRRILTNMESWEQLRGLSREEIAARILADRSGSDPGSGVNAS